MFKFGGHSSHEVEMLALHIYYLNISDNIALTFSILHIGNISKIRNVIYTVTEKRY